VEVSLRCKTVLLVGGMMDEDVCLLAGMLGWMCVFVLLLWPVCKAAICFYRSNRALNILLQLC